MPCFFGCALLGFPRLAVLGLLITGTYVHDALAEHGMGTLALVAGLLILPWTTLALSFATHRTGGELETWSWILVIIAVVADMGAFRGGPSWSKDGD